MKVTHTGYDGWKVSCVHCETITRSHPPYGDGQWLRDVRSLCGACREKCNVR